VLRQTPEFVAETRAKRLDGAFGGAYHHVEALYGGQNPYMDMIDRNVGYLNRVLRSENWRLLRRNPPVFSALADPMATVRGLLEYFRSGRFGSDGGGESIGVGTSGATGGDAVRPGTFRALFRLNFLRAAVAVAAIFGFVGAAIVAGFASSAANPQPGLAFLLFIPMVALVGLAWSVLNWVLSLAQMFAVRNGEDAMGAIAATVTFCRERFGAVIAVSIWGGLAHLVALVAAFTVGFMMLGFVTVVPRLVVAAVLLVAVIYSAVADWLYMARLAGYTCIAEVPEALLKPEPPKPFVPILRTPLQTTIDRDERILSDLPGLA